MPLDCIAYFQRRIRINGERQPQRPIFEDRAVMDPEEEEGKGASIEEKEL